MFSAAEARFSQMSSVKSMGSSRAVSWPSSGRCSPTTLRVVAACTAPIAPSGSPSRSTSPTRWTLIRVSRRFACSARTSGGSFRFRWLYRSSGNSRCRATSASVTLGRTFYNRCTTPSAKRPVQRSSSIPRNRRPMLTCSTSAGHRPARHPPRPRLSRQRVLVDARGVPQGAGQVLEQFRDGP